MSMTFMLMLSPLSAIRCGGTGVIARMAGGDIPIMAGAGTAGTVLIGASAGEAGMAVGMVAGMLAGMAAGDTRTIITRLGDILRTGEML